ncbi:hypothetical protein TrCOL_g4303 [Triparma columacea]|uniref:Uncharacterized protein n=1 Tax=Triparma columacea TaxID=722753 RepID=A0A9W7GEU7_9STRA|nr:hypothetical protein TrCOL_g4303 [Triparma columacea]
MSKPRKRQKSGRVSEVDLESVSRHARIERDKKKGLGGGRGNLNSPQMKQHIIDILHPNKPPPRPKQGSLNNNDLITIIREWDEKVGNQRSVDTTVATTIEANAAVKAEALAAAKITDPLVGVYLAYFERIELGLQTFPPQHSKEFQTFLQNLSKGGLTTKHTGGLTTKHTAGVQKYCLYPTVELTASAIYERLSTGNRAYNPTSLLHEQYTLILLGQKSKTPIDDIPNLFEIVKYFVWDAGTQEETTQRVRECCRKFQDNAIADNEDTGATYMNTNLVNDVGELWVSTGSEMMYSQCVSDARRNAGGELGSEFTRKEVKLFGGGEFLVDLKSDDEKHNIIATRNCLLLEAVGGVHTSHPTNPDLDLVYVNYGLSANGARDEFKFYDEEKNQRFIGRGRVCLAAMLGERHGSSLCQCEHADGIRSVCGSVMDCSKVMNIYLRNVRRGEGFYYWWSPWKKA